MDVVVIGFRVKWCMLSRKWVVDVGGSIQMDSTYADIPASPHYSVRLYRE